MVKGSADEGLEALVLSVNRNIETLEEEISETKEAIQDVVNELDKLPKRFIPRPEAQEKANAIRRWIAGVIFAGIVVAASAFTGWMFNYERANKSLDNCEATREGFRQVIETAVSNMELREQLLAVDGTKPELCR